MSTSRAYIQKSKTNYWGTPTHILDQYRGWFDPCPFPKPEWDGLSVNWLSHDKIFCNTPYDNIKAWAKKMLRDADDGQIEQSTGRDSSVDSSPHGYRILSRVYQMGCRHTLYPGALKVCRLDRRVEETHQRTVS